MIGAGVDLARMKNDGRRKLSEYGVFLLESTIVEQGYSSKLFLQFLCLRYLGRYLGR